MTNAKRILDTILADNNLNISQLAKVVGVEGHILYGISRGRNSKISFELAKKLNQAFPQYSMMWLLTGNDTPSVEIDNLNISDKHLQADNNRGNISYVGGNNCPSASAKENEILKAEIERLQDEVGRLRQQVSDQMQVIINLSSK